MMRAPLKQRFTIALLIALTAFECVRGLVPALSRLDSDFPNYLTSAKIVADGRSPERLYDDSWFREQARDYGMPSLSTFSPFPPPTALILLPLAPLSPLTALRVMSAVSVLCLISSALLLAKVLRWRRVDSAVFILLSGNAIISGLRLGQLYIVISSLCIFGYYAYLRGRFWLAGVAFGLFAPIKYYPLIFPAYLAARREWKVVLGALAAVFAVALISVGVLGWKIHETFLLSVFGNHLIARLGQQDPFATAFQSFDTLFRTLFVLDPVLNPHPLWPAPLVQVICTILAKFAAVLAAAVTLIRLARATPQTAVAPSMGILGILVMLIAPATATYHFALFWLPVGLLINYLINQGARAYAYFLLGAYALIGFFPYKFTFPFEGRGGLSVLAYPRLFLVAAMFVACVYFVLSQDPRSRRSPVPEPGGPMGQPGGPMGQPL